MGDIANTLHARRRRVRTRAVALLAVLLAAVVIAAGLWILTTYSRARGIGDRLVEVQALVNEVLAAPDAGDLEPLLVRIEAVRPDLASLRGDMGPVRFAGAVLGWLPSVGRDLRVAPRLVDRAAIAVDAALETGQGALDLDFAYRSAAGDFDAALAAYSAGVLSESIQGAIENFDAAALLVEESIRLAGDERVAEGRFHDEARRVTEVEDRLIGFIAWAQPAALTVQRIGPVLEAAEPLLAVFEDEIGSPLEAAALVEALTDLEVASKEAYGASAAAVASAPAEIARSSIGADLRALNSMLRGVSEAAGGGRAGVGAMAPAMELLAESTGLLSDGQTLLSAMDRLAQEEQALADAALKLESAARTLRSAAVEARTTRWGGLVDRVRRLAERVQGGVEIALSLPAIGGELFGKNGPRTYLVLGQTADELRASGGFVSGVWLMTFSGGALVDVTYQDVVAVDDLTRLELYPPPPMLLEQHMSAPVWLMRDVSWEPDFPSTGAIARELYRLGQGRSVDGVIAITPWAFVEIADALGSIPTTEGPVGPDALMQALETGTDRLGREYMDTLFQDLLDAVDSGHATARLFDLAAALNDSLVGKQLMIYLEDAEAQVLVAGFEWAGELATPAHDRLTPIDSNVGWSKVDRNIKRSVSYRILLDVDGPARAHLELSYTNASGPESTGCESQKMDRGLEYDLLKNTCYWNLLRTYVSDGAELVRADQLPLPANSILEQVGMGRAGEDTMEILYAAGGTALTGLLTVPPGETRSVSFVYDLPSSVVDWGAKTSTYSLTMQHQPGTLGRSVKIEVVMPEGFEFVGSSIAPAGSTAQSVLFEFVLRQDTVITVDMQPAGAA